MRGGRGRRIGGADDAWPREYGSDYTLCAYPGLRGADIGAGNGAFAAALAVSGFEVTAVEPTESGVEQAGRVHPGVRVHKGSAYDELGQVFHGRYLSRSDRALLPGV